MAHRTLKEIDDEIEKQEHLYRALHIDLDNESRTVLRTELHTRLNNTCCLLNILRKERQDFLIGAIQALPTLATLTDDAFVKQFKRATNELDALKKMLETFCTEMDIEKDMNGNKIDFNIMNASYAFKLTKFILKCRGK